MPYINLIYRAQLTENEKGVIFLLVNPRWAVNRLYLHTLIDKLSDDDIILVNCFAEILIKAREEDFIGLFSPEDLSCFEDE